jgi:hypothetical protein
MSAIEDKSMYVFQYRTIVTLILSLCFVLTVSNVASADDNSDTSELIKKTDNSSGSLGNVASRSVDNKMQLPRMNADVDSASFEFLGGGMNVVSSEEMMIDLKKLFKKLGVHGGMIAIKNLCPECEDMMEWLDERSDWMNQLARESCIKYEKQAQLTSEKKEKVENSGGSLDKKQT